jgi:chromosome segregation ATPase
MSNILSREQVEAIGIKSRQVECSSTLWTDIDALVDTDAALREQLQQKMDDWADRVRVLAETVRERDTLTAKVEALSEKYKNMVTYYDTQEGTPCEQIRHQQEVEHLTARLREVERQNTSMHKRINEFCVAENKWQQQLADRDAHIATLTARLREVEAEYKWSREGWLNGWLTYTGYSENERYEQWMDEKPKSFD